VPFPLADPNDTGLFGNATPPLVVRNNELAQGQPGDVYQVPGSFWVKNQFRIGTPCLFLVDPVDGSIQMYGPALSDTFANLTVGGTMTIGQGDPISMIGNTSLTGTLNTSGNLSEAGSRVWTRRR
jgi:hypothetical protein